MRHFLLFSLLLIIFKINHAATDSLNYLVKHYTVDNGLPQNSVKSIGSDDLGFIWMATEAGLVRYDGQTFKRVDPKKLGLKTARTRYLQQSARHQALIAFSGSDEMALISKGDAHILTEKITERPPAKRLVGGICYAVGLPLNPIGKSENYLIHDEYKNQYIITSDSIDLYNTENHLIFKKAFKHADFHGFFLLENTLFHLNNRGLLNRIDRKESNHIIDFRGDILKYPIDSQNPKLYWNLASGQVFASVNRRLYFLTLLSNGNIHTRLLLNNLDIESDQIISIFYETNTKRIYLGSHTKGLYIFEPKHFNSFIAGKKLDQTLFYAQLPYLGNRILSSQGYVFDSSGHLSYLPEIAKKTRDRFTLLKDKEKHIWTTADSSIYEFDSTGTKLLNEVKTTATINRLYSDANPSIIWLGAYNGNLQQYNKKSKQFKLIHNFRKEITWLEQSEDGPLWIGTVHGLYRFHPRTEKIDSIKGLENFYIRSLYLDQEKNSWICTDQNGFYLYTKGVVHQMPLDKEGYLSAAHCILEDSLQNLWISTNNGLFQVPKYELFGFVHKRISPVFTYYDKNQGFLSNEFNGGCQPCGIQLSNGDFAFPSILGIVRFNPLNIKATSVNNDMIIDDIVVDGKHISFRDTLRLDPDFSQLQISVKTPYFGHPNNLHIDYQMNGSPKWLPLTNRNIILSKLPSGRHVIRIRKILSTPNVRFQTVQLVIVIPPLFYENWWFISLIFILMLLIIWLIITARVKQFKKKNSELQALVDQRTLKLQEQITVLKHTQQQLERQTHLHKRLSASISHDVKTPLRFIGLTLKKIHERLVKEQHPLAEMIADIQIASNGVHDYALMLTDYSKFLLFGNEMPPTSTIKLHVLMDEKIKLFYHIAEQKGIQIKNEIAADLSIINYQELLSIVFHNLIDNAIKFTLEGTIQLKSNVIGSRVKLTIEDSGMGMSSIQVTKINDYNSKEPSSQGMSTQGLGLKITKDLVAIMQGWMRISSQPKEGTVITIELPLALSSKKTE
jgi:signal transduction histidine kinase